MVVQLSGLASTQNPSLAATSAFTAPSLVAAISGNIGSNNSPLTNVFPTLQQQQSGTNGSTPSSSASSTSPGNMFGISPGNTNGVASSLANSIFGTSMTSVGVDNGPPGSIVGNGSSGEASPGSSNSNQDISGDAEGVWSPDIDQAFHEALQIYPPCGRRKIILSDEGKMYGRNELIARYIKIRCGKTRTRKQVSSHIQVLARKRQREVHSKVKNETQIPSGLSLANVKTEIDDLGSPPAFKLAAAAASMSDATVSAAAALLANNVNGMPPASNAISSLWHITGPNPAAAAVAAARSFQANGAAPYYAGDANENILQQYMQQQVQQLATTSPTISKVSPKPAPEYTLASSKLSLSAFDAYVQQPGGSKHMMLRIPSVLDEPQERIAYEIVKDKYPLELGELTKSGPSDAFYLVKCWCNIGFDVPDYSKVSFAVDSSYDSTSQFEISVSHKVCSFGSQVVEKVEVYTPCEKQREDGSTYYHFSFDNSPMCDYMVRFIAELKKLQAHNLMNSVLNNFTVLQIVTNKDTHETLLAIAFCLEVSPDPEPQCRVYRITQ